MSSVLFVPWGEPTAVIETPFGSAPYFMVEGRPAFVRLEGQDARARVWAAKDWPEVTAILAVESVESTLPLLEPGDLVVPGDVIDQTRLQPHTFFPGKGYGFVQMTTPFCPATSRSLLAAARTLQPRTFHQAVYVGTEGPRELTPAERSMYAQWGAHVAGTKLLPEAFLARELELCYAALTVVGPVTAEHLALLAGAPAPVGTCTCGEAMARTKAAGNISPDWKSWVVRPT